MDLYFHEINPIEWLYLKETGMIWEECAKKYKQPDWCRMAEAVDPMGCWSLVGHMVADEEFCKDCEYCRVITKESFFSQEEDTEDQLELTQ